MEDNDRVCTMGRLAWETQLSSTLDAGGTLSVHINVCLFGLGQFIVFGLLRYIFGTACLQNGNVSSYALMPGSECVSIHLEMNIAELFRRDSSSSGHPQQVK